VEGPQFSLGPARDGPCNMEGRAGRRAPSEDERRQRRMRGVPSIDRVFETFDVASLDAVGRCGAARGDRELGLGDEQFLLEPADQLAQLGQGGGKGRLDLAEVGPELVKGAVGANPRRVLVYARTMGETGRSAVARAGVETRDALASGRQGNWSKGELRPWTGQNEICSTSLCLAS
jgi:hypothetical protein